MEQGDEPGPFLIDLIFATSLHKCISLGLVHQLPDPFVAPRGVVEYIKRVADAGDGLPLVIYLRNDLIGTDSIKALCDIKGR